MTSSTLSSILDFVFVIFGSIIAIALVIGSIVGGKFHFVYSISRIYIHISLSFLTDCFFPFYSVFLGSQVPLRKEQDLSSHSDGRI